MNGALSKTRRQVGVHVECTDQCKEQQGLSIKMLVVVDITGAGSAQNSSFIFALAVRRRAKNRE